MIIANKKREVLVIKNYVLGVEKRTPQIIENRKKNQWFFEFVSWNFL